MKWTSIFYSIAATLAAAPNVVFVTEPPNLNSTKLESKIRVLDGNMTGYYYATEGFFDKGQVGYMGLQPREGIYNQHLTYSVFDDGPLPNSDTCHPGADGGSGVSCALEYPWRFNRTYTFVNERSHYDSRTGVSTWQGHLIDDESGERTFVGLYTTPPSYGVLGRTALCFNEFYDYQSWPEGECNPPSSYIQYAPVFYEEDGTAHPTKFSYFGGADFEQVTDDEVYFYNLDTSGFKLGNDAVKFVNGVCK